jgi:hypothetical protein
VKQILSNSHVNNDPDKKQRIKVTIPNHLVGDVALLPWVAPIQPTDFGNSPTTAIVSIPIVGSIVNVEFQNGELQYGLVTGTMHTAKNPLPADLAANYPNRRGWKDPAGNIFYIDITKKSEDIGFLHGASGLYVNISAKGAMDVWAPQDISITSKQTINVTADKDLNGRVGQNTKLDVGGTFTGTIKGAVTVTTPSTFTLDAKGGITMTTAGALNITATGTATISAAGGSATINGSGLRGSPDVKSNVSLNTHIHTGVIPGGGTSGGPV